MTEQERADVRTAYRPLIEGFAGKLGTVSYDAGPAKTTKKTKLAPKKPNSLRFGLLRESSMK